MKSHSVNGETKYIARQFTKERDFWMNRLSGDIEKSCFPYDIEETGKNKRKMVTAPVEFPGVLVSRLIKASGGSDARLHMLLAAGLIQLLSKYTGRDDIIIGIPIYRQESEGQFVNTLLTLRNRLANHMTFKDLLMQVKQTLGEANEHLNYPIETIPHDLGMTYSQGDDFPLFDIILMLENVHDKDYIQPILPNMVFSFTRSNENLEGVVEYNACLYTQATLRRIIGYFTYLLQETLFNANSEINGISLLPVEEREQVLFDFNATEAGYPQELTMTRLFTQQAESTPHRIALVCAGEHLTYSELDAAANRIGGLLIKKGVNVNTIVGIMGKRSNWIIAAIIGILKANGTYLPINAKDPDERIRFILEDSKARVLITQEHLVKEKSSFLKIDSLEDIIYIEDLMKTNRGDNDGELDMKPELTGKPGDNIYVIYTSGTTGEPKGVAVTHRSAVNYTWWAARTYVKNERIHFPLYTSIAFDLTVTSIFTPLITGNAVVVYGGDSDESPIEKVIADNQVGVIKLTPSHLKLIRENKMGGRISAIKRLVLGGEALDTQLAMDIHNNFNGNIEIYNEYGPTEATVGSMIYRFDPHTHNRKTVPIGIPIANTQIYLLNEKQEPLPMGIPGEIYISGHGTTAGYLYRPGLTAEKFLPNPFLPGEKMYKTGDLGRRLEEGNIEFLGRKDSQVKIRGFRIETGEIESCLLKHNEIKDAVVITRQEDTGDNYLCAYIVPDRKLTVSELREYLAAELPDYMIPSYFVELEGIPLTANGKLDKKALPEPKASIGGEYIAPRSEVERKLVDIWAEILKIEAGVLGIDLNFFELGGHSLNATVLASEVHKEFEVRIALAKVFELPTIRSLAHFIENTAKEKYFSIRKVEKKEFYQLSSAQRRFFVLHRLEPEGTTYNIPTFIRLQGNLDRVKLEDTFARIVKRHESLRTALAMVGEEALQRIHEEVSTGIEYYEVEGGLQEDSRAAAIVEGFIRPFDVSRVPLLRVGVIHANNQLCGDNSSASSGIPSPAMNPPGMYILMVDIHHIVSDGLSMELILKDFMAFYAGEELPVLTIQYKDYALWQAIEREKRYVMQQRDFWLKEFAGEVPVLNLPLDFPRPSIQGFSGGNIWFELGKHETREINRLASAYDATLFMVVLAFFTIFLSKLSGQEDIVIGTPVAGRSHTDLDTIIGPFVNTLALRNYPLGEQSFGDFLASLRERTLAAFNNQDYPFEDLVECVGVNRDISRSPLFDVMLVWDNMAISEMQIPGLKASPYDFENKTSKFDLSLEGLETEDKVSFRFEYSASLFKKVSIERFSRYFKEIVTRVIANPGKISEIEILPAGEKRKLLEEFNDTRASFPAKFIHQLFEEQVERTPGSIALESKIPGKNGTGAGGERGTITVTYDQFNRAADQLARRFREAGIRPGSIAAIMAGRSIETVMAISGILKAGGAYLPIETDCPPDRINYMLADSDAKILVTMQDCSREIKFEGEVLYISDAVSGISSPVHVDQSSVPVTSLAYVIYTSGTTGRPKAVMVEHRSAVNVLIALQREYPLKADDAYLLKTSYIFDVSVAELFGWFFEGGRLAVLEEQAEKDPYKILDTINQLGVTHINFVPSMFNAFAEILNRENIRRLSGIKYIFLAGEALLPGVVEKFRKHGTGIRLENIYGPTEGTVYSSRYSLANWDGSGSIPIGNPMSNTCLYILNKNNHLQPLGVPGELCISGIGVARGYLNRPQLTSEKFEYRNNQKFLRGFRGRFFQKEPPGRRRQKIYKTGDMARWQEDGNIEFLGRSDHQVKIRGFRIECGEIEKRLLSHEAVNEAVVIVNSGDHDSGDRYLSAFIVANQTLSVPEIRGYLSVELPGYMLPSYFIRLDELPLTPSGKIDRSVLTGSEGVSLDSGVEYVPPRNELERKLVETWGKVLGRGNIGIDEDFFEIGGDSIKAIQIAARMNVQGYKLDMYDIFRNSSIARLSPVMKKGERRARQSMIKGSVPLTPIQKWFFAGDLTDLHHYNHAVLLHSREVLEEEGIKAVFSKIQQHHDALRMTFKWEGTGVIQTNHGLEYPFSLSAYDYRNMNLSREKAVEVLEEKINEIQASFDLETGPLMKVGLFHLDDGDRLLIVIHHLVIDGISWRILFEDIERLYRQHREGQLLALPLKTDSFKLWAEELSRFAHEEKLLEHNKYWSQPDRTRMESISRDFPGGSNYVVDADRLSFTLDEPGTAQLLTGVNHAFGTEINDILLTALAGAVKKTWGLDRLLIALEGHGREKILENININRTVGWFTCIYPVMLEPGAGDDLGRRVKEIKERLRQVPANGIGYGILRYLAPGNHREGLEFKHDPRISFNYMGQFDEELEQASFVLAEESVGHTRSLKREREYELEISGMITGKRLELAVIFNRKQYKAETLQAFLGHYQTELSHIISFCTARQKREFTPGDFTYKELSIEMVDRLTARYPVQDIYTLSPMQQGMFYHWLQREKASTHFLQISYRILGTLDIPLVEKSINELCQRHDILRTAFILEGGDRPVQVILEDREVNFYYEDIRRAGSDSDRDNETNAYINKYKEKDRERGFHLSEDVLLRVAVFRLAEAEYEFAWSFHHILMDGWCLGILNSEFLHIYGRNLQGLPHRLPPVQPYRTYIKWLEGQDKNESRNYWFEYLKDYDGGVHIPGRKIVQGPGNAQEYNLEEITLMMRQEDIHRLNRLAGHYRLTLNSIIQAAWGIVLGKHNGKQDVVFGVVVSGRPTEVMGVETMVGLFINTIPVRIRYDEDTCFKDLLIKIQQNAIEGEAHHYYPLANIQSESPLKQDLLDHILVFENFPAEIQPQEEAANLEAGNQGQGFSIVGSSIEAFVQTNFDFDITIAPEESIKIILRYNANVYKDQLIKKIGDHFLNLLQKVPDQAETCIKDLKLASAEKRKNMLNQFTETL